jgi:hypothetical protein
MPGILGPWKKKSGGAWITGRPAFMRGSWLC